MFGEGLCPPEPSKSNNTEVVVRVTTEVVRPGQARLPCQGAAQAGDVGHDRRVEQHLQRPATDNTAHFSPRNQQTHKLGNILMLNLWNNRLINPNGSI